VPDTLYSGKVPVVVALIEPVTVTALGKIFTVGVVNVEPPVAVDGTNSNAPVVKAFEAIFQFVLTFDGINLICALLSFVGEPPTVTLPLPAAVPKVTAPVVVMPPVKVCEASVRAITAVVDGNVIDVPSVPTKVSVLLAVRVLPAAIVNVPVPVVIVLPLIDVAVATPNSGVTSVGDVSITNFVPVPVCDAIEVALPVLVIGPVKFAFVVTWPAVRLAAVPVNCTAEKILYCQNTRAIVVELHCITSRHAKCTRHLKRLIKCPGQDLSPG
jgi:hypothetical protein